MVSLTIIEARGLQPDSSSRKIHPYVQVDFEHGSSLRTNSISGIDAVLREQRGLGKMSEPRWLSQIEFRMDNPNKRITFKVMNTHDFLRPDGNLGYCTHTISSLGGLVNKTVEVWLPLKPPPWMDVKDVDEYNGELHLAVTLNVPVPDITSTEKLHAHAVDDKADDWLSRPLETVYRWSDLLSISKLKDALTHKHSAGILLVQIGTSRPLRFTF